MAPGYKERAGALYKETSIAINNPAFDGLAGGVFDYTLTPHGALNDPKALDERAESLVTFAEDYLNFRGGTANRGFVDGAQRQRTNFDVPGLEPGSPRAEAALGYSNQLGCVATTHAALLKYTVGGIFGAANAAPRIRLEHEWQQAERGVNFGQFVMLGSARKLFRDKDEHLKVAYFAPEAATNIDTTEFDLMCAAVEHKFGRGLRYTEDELPKAYDAEELPRVRVYSVDGKNISVIRAPRPDGYDRANSGHTLTLMRLYIPGLLGTGKNVLFSTNARYRPFQSENAKRQITLVSGAITETIGYDAETEGRTVRPAEYLQEVKSYIDVLVSVHRQVADISGKRPSEQN
jgi:hypothetical protein